MGSIGPAEILVVLVVALIVLGPNRLPEAARQMGRAFAEIRKLSSGFQAELRDVMTDPVDVAPSWPAAADETGAGTSNTVARSDAMPGSATQHGTGESVFRWSDLPPAHDSRES